MMDKWVDRWVLPPVAERAPGSKAGDGGGESG